MHLVVKMFSGIVEEKGQISALSKGKGHLILTVNCSESFSKDIVIETSDEWSKYLSEKGYVGINGCSITIGKINDSRFQIHLIPETLKATNLDNLIFGDVVNLELDQSTIAIVDTTERILKHKA